MRRSLALAAASSTTAWAILLPLPEAPSTESLPRAYDSDAICAHWSAQPRRVTRRRLEIIKKFTPFACSCLRSWYRGSLDSDETKFALAVQLRALLVDLGPTFIKFGQALSIRPDLMPPAAIAELQKLCDECPTFDTRVAIDAIRTELGAQRLEELTWLDVDPETSLPVPIAAASLGQVYRADLRPSGGGGVEPLRVAIKVQRPDMVSAVSLDLHILRGIAEAADWFHTKLTAQRPYHADVLTAFATASYFELDYEHEASNQETFAAEIATRLKGEHAVYVPRVVRSHVARRVLATEWVEGTKLSSCDAATINTLVATGVQCFLIQLLDLGFFHCDPHPGNLLVRAHPETGRPQLALIDFGLCARVPPIQSRTLVRALVSVFTSDMPRLIDEAIALGFLPATLSAAKRAELVPVLETIVERGLLAAGSDMASRRAKFGTMTKELNRVFFDYEFSVPPWCGVVTRALVTLEVRQDVVSRRCVKTLCSCAQCVQCPFRAFRRWRRCY